MAPVPSNVKQAFDVVAQKGGAYDREDSPTDRYYAFLFDVENAVNPKSGAKLWSVQFEMVPFEWMESAVLSQDGVTRSPPPSGPASLLVFDDAAPDDLAKALGTPVDEIVSGEWYVITLGKGGLSAQRARPVAVPSVRRTTAKGYKVPRRQMLKLNKRFRPVSRFSIRAIVKMLRARIAREVGVMDVGQASCNLVYDAFGSPQFYVDVGLPMFFNFASMPPVNGLGNVEILNPGPCLQNNPIVIVTHFHFDHYSMAAMSANWAALVNRNWLVPNQVVGPVAWLVINNVNASVNGQIHVFPVALAGLVGGYVNIIQCAPAMGMAPGNLNNTGLAVVVTINDLLQTNSLLPGDAAFQAIPGVGGIAGLRWLVASHHGSDTDLIPAVGPSPIPAPNVANQGRLSYSYGINGGPPLGVHCYGHPDAPAVAAYIGVGWGTAPAFVASTAETGPNTNVAGRGNIMMCNNVIPPACGVANCPFHAFPKRLV
ncbi:hypothetical protein ACVIHI_009073 [Bradyrhizobium sp. USDA 4524]|uniref:hypothetical protein n=1 Tax=unclassified Bradyrhizobium TaxID=2631580 RepID=UPI0020A1A50F|nr:MULTISPECIES: hypothetical protein [unclassified Bradyrhizobium]MCP1846148.1 hypothetical protein [Bradyrhizobium sp. USDA 4538]MCP1907217.1 hypothetical protein [Bradyrhizobium sp. USDA 4537]MCP1985693.1 hypothetical protein [Bradyrhizobium sp. USDA 4539]